MPSYLPVQDGYAVGGGWDGDSEPLALSGAIPFPAQIGLVYDCSGAQISSGSLTLTASASSEASPFAVIRVLVDPSATPSSYSASALPESRGELLLAEWPYAGPDLETTLTFGVTNEPLNQAEVDAGYAAFLAISANPAWNHRIAFTLDTSASESLTFEAFETSGGTAATLTTTEAEASESPAITRPITRGLRIPHNGRDGGILDPPR